MMHSSGSELSCLLRTKVVEKRRRLWSFLDCANGQVESECEGGGEEMKCIHGSSTFSSGSGAVRDTKNAA